MVNQKRKIVWDNSAKQYLRISIQYIKQDSPQNADEIKNSIRLKIKSLPDNPERYPLDKYRANNDGSYRALELYGFRISYFIKDTEIRIVRIRHTRQKPLNY